MVVFHVVVVVGTLVGPVFGRADLVRFWVRGVGGGQRRLSGFLSNEFVDILFSVPNAAR